jgi:hypothetical protein
VTAPRAVTLATIGDKPDEPKYNVHKDPKEKNQSDPNAGANGCPNFTNIF